MRHTAKGQQNHNSAVMGQGVQTDGRKGRHTVKHFRIQTHIQILGCHAGQGDTHTTGTGTGCTGQDGGGKAEGKQRADIHLRQSLGKQGKALAGADHAAVSNDSTCGNDCRHTALHGCFQQLIDTANVQILNISEQQQGAYDGTDQQ